MKDCLDMRRETVTSTWQKGNILKGDSLLDKMDFCGWLSVDQRWTAPWIKFDLLCNHISGCHLSAVPQLCHHLRFYQALRGLIWFQNQHTQNEKLLGFQITSGESWLSLHIEQILKPLPWLRSSWAEAGLTVVSGQKFWEMSSNAINLVV